MKRIREWLERREARRWDQQYQAGYGWAWSEYMVACRPLEEIEAYIYGRSDPFDQGAQKATFDIERLVKGTEYEH